MKNILIIAKFNKFKEENSTNRINFLHYLSTKSNIKLLNDIKNNSIRVWIKKTKKRCKWEPNVILYYFLSAQSKWTTIEIPDFNYINIPKYMFFEDFHYSQITIPLYLKYKFKTLLYPLKHLNNKIILKKYNVSNTQFGFYIDTKIFKIYENCKKQYDILYYGFINHIYPLRSKIYKCLKLLAKNTNYKILFINHPGYVKKDNNLPINDKLAKLLNQSKFSIATSSTYNLMVKKYFEIPLCGTTIIGDIPTDYNDLLKNNMVNIQKNANEITIYNILLKCCEGKYDNIVNNNNNTLRKIIQTTYNFESGYNKLNEIIV